MMVFENSSAIPACVSQNLVKENLKNKQEREGAKKADSPGNVGKVVPKVEGKSRGETACHFSP